MDDLYLVDNSLATYVNSVVKYERKGNSYPISHISLIFNKVKFLAEELKKDSNSFQKFFNVIEEFVIKEYYPDKITFYSPGIENRLYSEAVNFFHIKRLTYSELVDAIWSFELQSEIDKINFLIYRLRGYRNIKKDDKFLKIALNKLEIILMEPYGSWNYWHFFTKEGGIVPFNIAFVVHRLEDYKNSIF